MKILVRLLLFVLILGGLGAAATPKVRAYLKERNRPKYRTETVSRGSIRYEVTATGDVKPTLEVSIGSFVSGPVIELLVDFNTRVKEGDLLAKIDPRIYQAAVAQDRAILATTKAEVSRVKAQLQQAINDEQRALKLYKENPDFISDTELDRLKFGRLSLEAQLIVANASVERSAASLDNSTANLEYTEIKAPVDGIVIDRKIDPGQTLASQFQTPELFIIAPNMEEEMYVYASIDEMEIGDVKKAKEQGHPVTFTVDAYPDVFEGTIKQIRLSATEVQNVVTYPVVVSASNPDLKLLPGMTADLTFLIDEKKDVLRVPKSALRFYPESPELVHPDDRKILEGAKRGRGRNEKRDNAEESEEEQSDEFKKPSTTEERQERMRRRRMRHVWIQEDEFLRAVSVTVGLSDFNYSEIVEGDLSDDQELVIGIEKK